MLVGLLAQQLYAAEYTTNEKFNQIIALQWYDFANYKGFTEFVNRTKAIFSFQALIVDLRASNCNAEDIEKGVRMHRQFCSSKLIFVVDSRDHPLYDCLLSQEITNIIDLSRGNYENALLDCLMGKESALNSHITGSLSRSIELARQMTQPNITLPGKTVTIGVAGCSSRAGTTTIAMSIVSALSLANVKACYVDLQGKHLRLIKEIYSFDECEDHIVINQMSICEQQPSGQFDVIVYDYGCEYSHLSGCDIRILVSYSKLWELPVAAKIYKSIEKMSLIFNLAGKDDQEQIRKVWPDADEIFFMPFVESVWTQDSLDLSLWLKRQVEKL